MKPTSGFWRAESISLLFLATFIFYLFMYAPWGINESDGGFLTGLAWQILSGKTLYQDIIYVRPPLPVWLRALEIQLLPDHFAVLGERWIFYLKVAIYSWLGAAILAEGRKRWWLACFGFVLSVHCYPAAAWHTVDGILFAVFSAWCLMANKTKASSFFSGMALCLSLLCKQSFYPLLLVWAFWFLWDRDRWWLSWGFYSLIICFSITCIKIAYGQIIGDTLPVLPAAAALSSTAFWITCTYTLYCCC
jgi:hypothetical protein